ncbi:glycosyltransferase [Campylobacter californiensis]|uniref:glycosyltransferase n=1 Tax=Campylobacter californiensis TaxID=1032243 RepID=UPI0014766A1A|nr:glycosyltransferase [Campylobacter sp. RM12916]MBE3609300.1 glycosyltransferase [Campylobacter sp. RM12916]
MNSLKFLQRKEKDYSRFNIIKDLVKDVNIKNEIYILMPFSKNVFLKNFFKRYRIINDFFISNYDTYVYDRKKIGKLNPRAWIKFLQDYINFKFSKYLLSDTNEHFLYWQSLFGKFNGKHLVLPVLADKNIYYPIQNDIKNEKIKVLFYGSFIPLHGIDVILHAFSILEKDGVQFDGEIVGSGQTYKEYKRLFDKLDLKQVKMDGEFIAENDLAKIIRSSDIVLGVFGSSNKAKSVVPNKAYQALACKKPLITMHSKAIYEFFDDNEIMMCENSPEILAKSIKELIKNSDKRESLAQNGYSKFICLYEKTKIEFENFIKAIDEEIG